MEIHERKTHSPESAFLDPIQQKIILKKLADTVKCTKEKFFTKKCLTRVHIKL